MGAGAGGRTGCARAPWSGRPGRSRQSGALQERRARVRSGAQCVRGLKWRKKGLTGVGDDLGRLEERVGPLGRGVRAGRRRPPGVGCRPRERMRMRQSRTTRGVQGGRGDGQSPSMNASRSAAIAKSPSALTTVTFGHVGSSTKSPLGKPWVGERTAARWWSASRAAKGGGTRWHAPAGKSWTCSRA